MDVQMRHFLMPMPADIGEHPVAGIDQPCLTRDLPDGADETGDFLCRGLSEKSSQLT